MPKLTGPLMSLDASRTLDKLLTYYNRLGQDIVRKWTKPTNPRSVAQVAHRLLWSTCVNFFTTLLVSASRVGWTALAKLNRPQVGLSIFVREAMAILKTKTVATVSMATLSAAKAGMLAEFTLKNLDGTTGSETGNFDILCGLTPSSLYFIQSVAIVTGKVTASLALGDVGDVVYVALRKDDSAGISRYRSGIQAITLLAA